MAKRKSDPRVTIQAMPPLCRVKGKPAITTLKLHCATAHCDKCDKQPDVSFTQDGTISRYCLEHYLVFLGVQEEKRQITEMTNWAVARMSDTSNTHEWRYAKH